MDKQLLNKFLNMYKGWVVRNPNIVAEVETIATWSSYFIAGKINKSPIISELVYSLSKLISLYNDRILKEAHGDSFYNLSEQIKMWLTMLHYSEVFLELLVTNRCSTAGKWTTVAVLQIFKCSSALVLLYRFRQLPILHPPIPVLDRKKYLNSRNIDENFNGHFVLKRSGKVMRSVDGAPPVAFRDWVPLKTNTGKVFEFATNELQLAELLHIIKPLIHLAAIRVFGSQSWRQWFVALGMDLASLKLYKKHMDSLDCEQRLEISRRKLSLILYLIRSPMFNSYSKQFIMNTLSCTSNKIPIAGIITNPIMHYLSYWQKVYFYMWSS